MAVQHPVYLADFSMFRGDDELLVDFPKTSQEALKWKCVNQEQRDFVWKIWSKSGINDRATFLPKNLQPQYTDEPKTDLYSAAAEARLVYGQVIEEVLRKTGLKATDVDILVTNTSIYCPTPSIASMVINLFKMREDVQAYHLGGMGCAMGVVGLNLVRDLLAAHPGKICLFVSSEITSSAFYCGERKEALVTNALFRMGGSAAIMTSNPAWRHKSKYQLTHCVRVHTGASDRAFNALDWCPDEKGLNGMVITKTLPSEAANAMEKSLRMVTPHIMTWMQYMEAAFNYTHRAIAKATNKPMPKSYKPDYTKCADHFLLHAGGYAILRGVQKGLGLPVDKMMPSFVSLRDYGNTSSASTWYTWSYQEACGGVKKGERVMQVGVGGGMKSGVCVWVALRNVHDNHRAWAHLNGRVQTEADLPRPISNTYDSIFDLPGVKAAQAEAAKAAVSAPSVVDAAAVIAAQSAAVPAAAEVTAH